MHGRPDHPRSPAAKQGCETCHGPGSTHADDPEVPGLIRAFVKEPPRVANATCVTCHSRGTHALWEGSAHEGRNLSCVSCHSVHAFKSEKAQLKTVREMDTCATCHRDKAAKVDRSGHMPLREGKMECSTCHNPHGATNVRALRKGDSIGEMCTSCHADKRGPVPVGACPQPRRLHDLPRPARLGERTDARDQDADHVPAVSRHDTAPQHHLRLEPDRIRRVSQRAHLRAVVHHVPLDDSRVEPSERPAVHPVGTIMRITRLLPVLAVALAPLTAGAQTTTAPAPAPTTQPAASGGEGVQPPAPAESGAQRWTGSFDFGIRGSDVEGDRGRFERYRDLGDGLFLEGLRLHRERNGVLLAFQAEHVGRRDQRYVAEVGKPGRFAGTFMWTRFPCC
jgi:predicted CXXCH cytochrome family protein